jgi:hypothetical protein
MKIEGAEQSVVPIQTLFCLKEKKQKKDQLSSLVLQRLRSNTAAQRVYSARRRYDARPHLLRHQFKRRRRMRRNHHPEGHVRTVPDQFPCGGTEFRI